MAYFIEFMRDQIKLDEGLEDARIKLVGDRDFYPRLAFSIYLD